MIFCTHCGADIKALHEYCWNCGRKAETGSQVPAKAGVPVTYEVQPAKTAVRRTIGQMFGLDPRVAFLTLIVDMMLNAGDVATMGVLLPVSILAGIVLGYIAYKAQINWYGDDKESAKIKAIMLGLLTAIPTPLPELLYVPAGLLGLLHNFRRKQRELS